MISKILRAKNWQVFLVIFGSLFCIQFFLISSILETSSAAALGPVSFEKYFLYVPLAAFFTAFTMGTWLWSIGVGLQKIIPPKLQLNVKRFKILLLIPAVYFLFFIWVFIRITSIMLTVSGDTQASLELDWVPYIIPLHFFAIFCILYCIGFVAKTIKTAELQRTVQFGDCLGLFFSIWFLPIGIWSVQAKINHLVETRPTTPQHQKGSFLVLDDDLF